MESLTLNFVYYNLNNAAILDWLSEYDIVSEDDNLSNRLALTRILSEFGYINREEVDYVNDVNFDSFYLKTDEVLREYIGYFESDLDHIDLVKASIDLSYVSSNDDSSNDDSLGDDTTDSVGKAIFDIFVKKDKSNRIFENKKDEVAQLYEDKRLLLKDKYSLLRNIYQFEDVANKFIKRVDEERKFVEKSASGKPPRDIKTPQDWAEAIIEYKGLIEWFKNTIIPQISLSIDAENINEYCTAQNSRSCDEPCVTKSNLFGKKSCIYNREELLEKDCGRDTFENCKSPCSKKPFLIGKGGKCVYKV